MSQKKLHDSLHAQWQSLQTRALDAGAWVNSSISIFWDVSGKCVRPITRTLHAIPGDGKFTERVQEYSGSRYIDLHVACRKCPRCLRARSWLWNQRARREILLSSRTWFCTYTIRPDARVWFKCKAHSNDFEEIAAEIGKEFTKYLKRVRKQAFKKTGGRLRFMLVYEAHKDGFPHVHALRHEQGQPVTKRELQEQWPYGFSTIKVADVNTSHYVTKYLTKSVRARVRASQRYGQ